MATPVNYRETLVTYLRSDSMESAANQLKITVPTLQSRISTMRKAGVKVPKLSSTTDNLSSSLFVAQLNSLINRSQKEA
jgi:hypothetical protein